MVTLSQTCNGASLLQSVIPAASWTRAVLSGVVAGGDGVAFGIEVSSGAAVEVFGAQVEAQPAAGIYKRTMMSGGIYENCRFDQDELLMTATEPGVYGSSMRIRSAGCVPWRA
jgi:hypothetical protein